MREARIWDDRSNKDNNHDGYNMGSDYGYRQETDVNDHDNDDAAYHVFNASDAETINAMLANMNTDKHNDIDDPNNDDCGLGNGTMQFVDLSHVLPHASPHLPIPISSAETERRQKKWDDLLVVHPRYADAEE